MLKAAGHEAEDWLPLSPMEIPERIQAARPDLVLSDYQMPGLSGLSVAKMVQKVDPTIKVVILTAIRDPEVDANLTKFGVARILHKPISEAELCGAVDEVLKG